jgi:hypothetical protein
MNEFLSLFRLKVEIFLFHICLSKGPGRVCPRVLKLFMSSKSQKRFHRKIFYILLYFEERHFNSCPRFLKFLMLLFVSNILRFHKETFPPE